LAGREGGASDFVTSFVRGEWFDKNGCQSL